MGKRSDFERKERDLYPTPASAVKPLLPFLDIHKYYCEPCAGDGALIDHLYSAGYDCSAAYDIEPQKGWIKQKDVFDLEFCEGDLFITNPPWGRKMLHPLITRLSNLAPTWLLFDADWMHTKQAKAYLHRCSTIVSVGRVKWFGNMTGKDNCCWYHFDKNCTGEIKFFGRD